MADEQEVSDVEVLSGGAIEALNRSEIHSQIEVAKRYPRSMERFKERAIAMACMDEETAASCLYRRPVGKKNGVMEYAEGLSIRTAEIVGASYGNLRVYATLLSQTERQVVARGMAIDLEANFASSSEVVEATVTTEGNPFSERMRAVVAKAALAKARRDATFQVVPKALAKPIEQAVRQLLHGDAKSFDSRRQQVSGWIKTLGIDEGRVWKALGIGGLADVGAKELETLTGLKTAIKDGEVSIDEAFPSEPIATPRPKPKETKADAKGTDEQPGNGASKVAAKNQQPAGDIVRESGQPAEGANSQRTDTRQGEAKDGKGKSKAKPAEVKNDPPKEDEPTISLKNQLLAWISTCSYEQLQSFDKTVSRIANEVMGIRDPMERQEVLTAWDLERRTRPEPREPGQD